MELTNFIETHIFWSFVIAFFIFLFLIFGFLWKFYPEQIFTDFDDEPYKPLKKVNDIEVDAEVLNNVPRHNQED
jgi:uncharacterized protein with PQ loop repeat